MSKQGPNIPKRQPGEELAIYAARVRQWLREDDMPRVRGDLRDWTGSPPFHLNREPT